MKKIFYILICFVVGVFVGSAQGQMIFTLKDATGHNIGNVYPVAVGETVIVTLEVSNIPDPGLLSMGYSFLYNSNLSLDFTLPNSNYIDGAYWPKRDIDDISPGKIDVFGARFGTTSILPSIAGDNIPIGTFTFKKVANGLVRFTIDERTTLVNGELFNPDDFVLSTNPATSLDNEISGGLIVGAFTDLGDYNGDGDFDGEDLARLIIDSCSVTCSSKVVSDFANQFGF